MREVVQRVVEDEVHNVRFAIPAGMAVDMPLFPLQMSAVVRYEPFIHPVGDGEPAGG